MFIIQLMQYLISANFVTVIIANVCLRFAASYSLAYNEYHGCTHAYIHYSVWNTIKCNTANYVVCVNIQFFLLHDLEVYKS